MFNFYHWWHKNSFQIWHSDCTGLLGFWSLYIIEYSMEHNVCILKGGGGGDTYSAWSSRKAIVATFLWTQLSSCLLSLTEGKKISSCWNIVFFKYRTKDEIPRTIHHFQNPLKSSLTAVPIIILPWFHHLSHQCSALSTLKQYWLRVTCLSDTKRLRENKKKSVLAQFITSAKNVKHWNLHRAMFKDPFLECWRHVKILYFTWTHHHLLLNGSQEWSCYYMYCVGYEKSYLSYRNVFFPKFQACVRNHHILLCLSMCICQITIGFLTSFIAILRTLRKYNKHDYHFGHCQSCMMQCMEWCLFRTLTPSMWIYYLHMYMRTKSTMRRLHSNLNHFMSCQTNLERWSCLAIRYMEIKAPNQ